MSYEDKYLMRYKVDALSTVVANMVDSDYPKEIFDTVSTLIAQCDEYICDGYSMKRVKHSNGDLDYIYCSPKK